MEKDERVVKFLITTFGYCFACFLFYFCLYNILKPEFLMTREEECAWVQPNHNK
jgi:hypothetical protein